MDEKKYLFTSEAVSEGHPDKVCDQVADAILDACLKEDPSSRVACECFATSNYFLIGGEITTKSHPDYERIARDVIIDIGYDKDSYGFNGNTCIIDNKIKKQSLDIAMGVDKESLEDLGAGDQGMMFGYACRETKNYMPLPIVIAHKLVRLATSLRKSGKFKGARPDMKAQVTIDYTHINRIDTILMSCQHDEDIDLEAFKQYIHDEIMIPVAKSFNLNLDFKYYINPTGRFVLGGPAGDTGLTGRKIIVDTYGGMSRSGGGAFSGKDPSKVDRSAAYLARYIAKNLVAAGVADSLEIQLSYGIGLSKPISIAINTFGSAKIEEDKILKIIPKFFDLRPGKIIEQFSLNKPSFRYRDLANYGHFGRPDIDCPWEKLDKVKAIKDWLGDID